MVAVTPSARFVSNDKTRSSTKLSISTILCWAVRTKSLPVGFIGGIAYYYQDILREVLDDLGFTLSTILLDPVEGLKRYHRKDVVPTQI